MAVIGLDFNGTCVTYDYPKAVGRDIGAVPVLRRLLEAGHEFVLMTCLTPANHSVHVRKDLYDEMIEWFRKNNIPIIGVNVNPYQDPVEFPPHSGKVRCDLYIDDHSLGIPLMIDTELSEREFVDWEATEIMLEENGFLPYYKVYQQNRKANEKV